MVVEEVFLSRLKMFLSCCLKKVIGRRNKVEGPGARSTSEAEYIWAVSLKKVLLF